ncbi:ATP-binding protein [Streptomyces sp. NPDC001833]|uniref:ATP-binding protein n=1 Tax=Streptomyces sp. NPDC001833 TaxID=3154658 RepID=UPI0033232133
MRITGSRQGHTQARTFTDRTACHWPLDHLSDGAVAWLALRLGADHLICAVSDPSGRPPVYPRVTDSSEENGRGLCIVEAVSEDRGWVRRSPAGRTFRAPLPTYPAALTRLP